ncbi:MAG: hypothetical protein AAGF87_15010 [Bacteroidota bacterium]
MIYSSHPGLKIATYGIVLLAVINFGSGCNRCQDEDYGGWLNLEIPVEVGADQDTFFLGDTLWIKMDMSKDVFVQNADRTIRLDDFQFFLNFFLAEISTDQELYLSESTIVERVGRLENQAFQTSINYPMILEETPSSYRLEVGILLEHTGLFYAAISDCIRCLERYVHPALFYCSNRRRTQDYFFQNIHTSPRTLRTSSYKPM